MTTVKEFLETIKRLSGKENIDDVTIDLRVNIRMEPRDIEDAPLDIPTGNEWLSLHSYNEETDTAIIQTYEG